MAATAKPKVYVTRLPLPGQALHMLQDKCDVVCWEGKEAVPSEVLLEQAVDADALFVQITDKIDKRLIDAAQNLRVIGTSSVGYDHIDLTALKERGIKLGYTPDVLTNATAELAVALTLATIRNFFPGRTAIERNEWNWSPTFMLGDGIEGSTVGIFGMGRIGVSCVEKLLPFHPSQIIYHNRSRSKGGQ